VVLSHDQLAKTNPVDGLMFSDDDQAWAHFLPLRQRPATFLIDTAGDVIWQHQGHMTYDEFVGALGTHLPAQGGFSPRVLQPALSVGHPVPNFMFESGDGTQQTLRKLLGQPVVLVFWKSTSRVSMEAVRDLERIFAQSGNASPVLLAINDGEAEEVVRRAACEFKAIIVPDPGRDIASACGINLWPTSVYLGRDGLVTDICYGRFCGQSEKSSTSAAD
jgi:hypothetical protein